LVKTVLYYTYTKTKGADMKTIFVVQAQGFGDDEDAFYNIAAFSTLALADAHIAELEEQDEVEDNSFVYEVDTVTLQA
jgi:hypothetical protein